MRQEDVRIARANWERAVSAANLAETTYKRINALYKDGLVSQQRNDEVETAYRSALDAANAARAQYDLTLNGFRKEERAAAADVTRGAGAAVQEVAALAADISLKSPISAEVDKVVLHQGELAPPGFPIISLVNLDDVWAVFNLREDELAAIKIDTQDHRQGARAGKPRRHVLRLLHQPQGRVRDVARDAPVERLRHQDLRGARASGREGGRPSSRHVGPRRPGLIPCSSPAFVARARGKSPICARIHGIWR